MESDSNIIPFPRLNTPEYATNYPTMAGFEIMTAEELVQKHPEAARAWFNCAREQHQSAIQTMGMLEEAMNMKPPVADIIDARDPEFWKNKEK